MRIAVLLLAAVGLLAAPGSAQFHTAPPPHLLTFVTVKYENVRGSYEERGTIWAADLDGTDRRRLAPGNVPDISPDRRWVAYLDDGHNLRVVPSGGGATRVIVRRVSSAGYRWAPDSRRIAFVVDGSLSVVDVVTGRRVAIARARAVRGFSFSPSGRDIAYGLQTGRPAATDGGIDIYRASVDGGSVRRLTRDRGSYAPVWGPDGIAFGRFEPYTLLHPRIELWFMRADGRDPRLINHANLAPFAWSRDGRRLLAYVVSEVDAMPVAVDPARGAARPLAESRGEVFTAAFSRDGHLVLVTKNAKLVQVPWAGGRPRVLGRRVDERADWTR